MPRGPRWQRRRAAGGALTFAAVLCVGLLCVGCADTRAPRSTAGPASARGAAKGTAAGTRPGASANKGARAGSGSSAAKGAAALAGAPSASARRLAPAALRKALAGVDGSAVQQALVCSSGLAAVEVGDKLRSEQNLDRFQDALELAHQKGRGRQHPRLSKRCLPALDRALAAVRAVASAKPSDDVATAATAYRAAIAALRAAAQAYVAVLAPLRGSQAHEQRVLAAARAFHKKGAPGKLAWAYVRFLSCAVPKLVKHARAVKVPPDAQKTLLALFTACKNDAAGFAKTLRSRCAVALAPAKLGSKPPPHFSVVRKSYHGDDRDVGALNWCFRRAYRAHGQKQRAALNAAYLRYRRARQRLFQDGSWPAQR